MLKLSLNLIWRYTTGGHRRLRFHTLLGELIDRFSADSWCSNWFAAADRRTPTGEICCTCWVSDFFVFSSGWRLLRLSFLECAAQSRASCPSSAALLWAQILRTFAALWLGEEAAWLFESTANPGEDRTVWEMSMTERDGPPNSSTRLADVLVSHMKMTFCQQDTDFNCNITWFVISGRQVTLQGMTVASVNLAGLDQTATRGKPLWYGRTSSPWPPRSFRNSLMLWNWLRPPLTQTMLLPPNTGWDFWDQMELSPRWPTSPSTTSLSGSIITLFETLSLVNEHGLNLKVFVWESRCIKQY